MTLANLVGTGTGMALTPLLVGPLSLGSVQLLYGGCALVAGIGFVLLARDRPPTPPEELSEGRALMLDGLRHALRVGPFVVFLALVPVGMGVFNGLSTWVDEIVRPRGFSPADAGTLGALLLLMALTRTSTGSFVPSLTALSGLLLVGGLVAARLPEPSYHLADARLSVPETSAPGPHRP